MRVSFSTFGCKLNQYETESLASAFRSHGHTLVAPDQEAEIYLVNTCTVTARAEAKARRLIRQLARQHPQALLLVTGCYAQLNREELGALAGNVRVVPQEEKELLLGLPGLFPDGLGLAAADNPDLGKVAPSLAASPDGTAGAKPAEGLTRDPFRFRVDRYSYHSRAFLKIQDGCDYRCSYCRVPLARGRSLSLEPEEAVRRAVQLEEHGYREMVLTGVNISSYRHGAVRLPQLLSMLLARTGGLRLRLSSLEPDMITPALSDVLREGRICPHFHLPVQSGSDAVLLAMGRRYRSAQVVRAAGLLRSARQDPFLAADLIVGFPGESEADFLATCRLVEELGFSKLHVFPFSPRPGTAAQGLGGRVPERVRDSRARELIDRSAVLQARYAGRWVGREVAVVLEQERGAAGQGGWHGVSENYLKVALRGVPSGQAAAGELVLARIESVGEPCGGVFLKKL